jgi:hypothetical protein
MRAGRRPLKALVERNPGVDFAQTDDVLMGAASSFAEQAYNVGRNATLLAGFDHHVPGCTVNRFCASSLQTLRMAFHAITVGEGDQYVAAGVESVSRTGLGAGMADEFKNATLDGSEGSLFDVYIPMGLTAENVADRCKVTREQQDEWAGSPRTARSTPSRAATSIARSFPSRLRTAPRSAATTARGRAPRWRSWATSSPSFGPTAASPPATRARSTTAWPPCSS